MKFSEKIITLRKSANMTQEDLAALCNVSRQSISKWEADVAFPETDKLLQLSSLFHVSLDVLLKDDLSINGAKEVHTCGDNALKEKQSSLYEGILIKESIDDENVLDCLTIHKLELWCTGGKPKYWTVLHFSSARTDFPEQISKTMISTPELGGNWFVDFKSGNEKYIVFRNKILKYHIGNSDEKEAVCAECRKMGISDEQMQWPE